MRPGETTAFQSWRVVSELQAEEEEEEEEEQEAEEEKEEEE